MRIKFLCLIGFCTLSLIACSKEKPTPQDTQVNQATREATINQQTTATTTPPQSLPSNEKVTTSESLEKSIADTGKATVYINFAVNKSNIEASSTETIKQIVRLLAENPTLKLAIQGHTDNSGDARKNLELSEKRAQSVRAALIENNIIAHRLEYKGFGQDVPIATNETPEGKAQNRRVELIKIE